MKSPSRSFALLLLSLPVAVACSSSSDDTSSATAPDDGGASSDAGLAPGADASAALDSSPSTTPDARPSTSPCSFSVSGDRTDPTTASVACPAYLKQLKGKGDYTINVAAGFASATMEDVNLGFIVSCPAAPKAGDVWTLGKDGCTGKLTLTVSKGQAGTIWSTSEASPPGITSATTITFGSVTMMQGTQRPEDVYYLFDVTLGTTLLVQPGEATQVKVSGHFSAAALPLGA